MAFNINKVNGHAGAGEFLGRQLDYYLLTSPVNILPLSNGGTSTTQQALDKLVEVISINGQPVILGNPYSAGGGNYALAFAIEHTGSWGNTVTAAQTNLVNSVLANAPVDFAAANATTLTVTITTTGTLQSAF
jgi:hypothetical protein